MSKKNGQNYLSAAVPEEVVSAFWKTKAAGKQCEWLEMVARFWISIPSDVRWDIYSAKAKNKDLWQALIEGVRKLPDEPVSTHEYVAAASEVPQVTRQKNAARRSAKSS